MAQAATPPYPRQLYDEKFLVWGPDRSGRIIEVVFATKRGDEIEFESIDWKDLGELSDKSGATAVYLIHAMPLDGRRLKQYRRNRR